MLVLKSTREKRLTQPLHQLPCREGQLGLELKEFFPNRSYTKERVYGLRTELRETVFPPLFKYHSFHVTTLRVPLHWGMIAVWMPRDVLKQKDRENTKDTGVLPAAA